MSSVAIVRIVPNRRYQQWVLPICRYDTIDDLLSSLAERVIVPAERKLEELRKVAPP